MKGEGGTPFLQVRDLVKTFGDFTAVDGIDLDITESEFFTIVDGGQIIPESLEALEEA